MSPKFPPVAKILHHPFLGIADQNDHRAGGVALEWRPDLATVLLIDDSPETRACWRVALQIEGHVVIDARDVLAGLQRAVEDSPDRILVAAALSGLDAAEVRDRLAEEPATAAIPVEVVAADPGLVAGAGWAVARCASNLRSVVV